VRLSTACAGSSKSISISNAVGEYPVRGFNDPRAVWLITAEMPIYRPGAMPPPRRDSSNGPITNVGSVVSRPDLTSNSRAERNTGDGSAWASYTHEVAELKQFAQCVAMERPLWRKWSVRVLAF